MTAISGFFKESDSSLGIFYPTHYIVASFPSRDAALEAENALRKAGMPEDDVLALSPEETVRFLESFRKEAGALGGAMTQLSRALGDDATFVDDDLERANLGAGFLFVYSPTDAGTRSITERIATYHPQTMHWYLRGGIQSLI